MRCMAAAVCLTALAACAAPCLADPGELLWAGQVAVESGGNPRAFNPQSGAAGIVQIRLTALADCNRIARAMGLSVQYSPGDRFNITKAREMWNLYLAFYGERYTEDTGRAPTNEVYARIWNGGPAGWKKESTREYWNRVRAAMPQEAEAAPVAVKASAQAAQKSVAAAGARPRAPGAPAPSPEARQTPTEAPGERPAALAQDAPQATMVRT